MTIPNAFCWTRFGTEAGQTISEIFARKEAERSRNDGVFLWGIGNNVAPSIASLLRIESKPHVLFSPIKSPPRETDVSPSQIAVWTEGAGVDGSAYRVPSGSLVTSRFHGVRKRKHYALVCRSNHHIKETESDEFVDFDTLVNVKSGKQIGSSQVTSIVRRIQEAGSGSGRYPVSFKAELVYPYVVELNHCGVVSNTGVKPEAMMRQAWEVQKMMLAEPAQMDEDQPRMFG